MKSIKNYEESYMSSIKDFFKSNGIVIITSIISSAIITSVMVYSIDDNKIETKTYNIIPATDIKNNVLNNDNIVEQENKDKNNNIENINKNSDILDNEIISNLELGESRLESDPLYRLQSDFKKEDFQFYIFGLLDEETKKNIDELLNEELSINNYSIDGIPQNVINDSVKSTILFYLSGGDLPAFDYIHDFRDKVNHSVAALMSLFKLETGSKYINYSTTVRSSTLAFGRGQINGSTLGEISVRLVDAGFPLNYIDHPYHGKQYKYPYHKIKKLVQYMDRDRKWSTRYKDKTINDLIKISKRFNYRVKTYLRDRYGKNIPDRFSFLLNDYGNFSNLKLYDWSIAMLNLYKDPVFQGYMSLHVLQEKMRIARRKYKGKIYSSNQLLYYSFELYNGNQKIVKDKNMGQVKYCRVYANKVNSYFKKYINHIKESNMFTLADNNLIEGNVGI